MNTVKMNLVKGHVQLFNNVALGIKQMKVVQDIINYWNPTVVEGQTLKTKLNREELREAHRVTHGIPMWGPHFIVKNVACKVKGEPGMFELGRLKLAAGAAKELAATPASTDVAPAVKSAPIKKGKKKTAAKPTALPAIAAPAVETEDQREDREREEMLKALEIMA